MKFRTIQEPLRNAAPISHDTPILALGSCFTDNIGQRLAARGFDILHNPMGPLYNPASLERIISRALDGHIYTQEDLVRDSSGTWHCLDFPLRYSHAQAHTLLEQINTDFSRLKAQLGKCRILMITLGTTYVFTHIATDCVAGNCHKLPAADFHRHALSMESIVGMWRPLMERLTPRRVIFTVSPIRHVVDGLHGNNLSKATLLLAADALTAHGAEYFPAYEAVMDDLRDYRFYESNLTHPTSFAADYIYELFSQTYFSAETLAKAAAEYKNYLRSQHRIQ
ncbi:MAG: GSCFA domain-containing protein [Muribaculaceae bacterium]|nr:GSCFA domain-containing protein [Muribaculaceae bacterium]